jgi:sterol desaturase/sphingolipid hydroxylase (fatty acid hydroxylase superfamily)
MSVVFAIVVSLLVSTLFGHFAHWVIHRPWTGPVFRGHMRHHLSLYPPSRFDSPVYLKAKWYESGGFLFLPFFVSVFSLVGWALLALGAGWGAVIAAVLTGAAYGLLSDYIHDSFHIRGHFLSRFARWKKWRDAHRVHHVNMSLNYGIFLFTWDRAFGTYRRG